METTLNIRNAPIVPDTRVYAVANVSKEAGRKRLIDLQHLGQVDPVITGTGRRLLSFEDAERLAAAL